MRGKETPGQGRLPESRDASAGSGRDGRDISEIDCQEGNMHPGETGGNFNSAEPQEQEKKDEKNPQ